LTLTGAAEDPTLRRRKSRLPPTRPSPLVDALYSLFPAWLMVTSLVGTVHGALFFLIVGRRPSSLFIYLLVAIVGASIVHSSGMVQAGSPPLSIGDVHLVGTSVAAWVALAVSRLIGL
jgi:hypothetical protein